MNNGWITLHRKLLTWEWWHDSNVVHLFIHCLLKANHAPKKWKGNLVERGQFITSQKHISLDTGLSVRQVRTALDKLKVTGELTVKITNKFSIISITNYSQYQDVDRPPVNHKSVQRQASDTQMTTNNNDNNINNENKKEYTPPSMKDGSIPYQEIIDLYHKKLPDLPKVAKLTQKRKSQIRQRWIEDLTEIEHWDNYFDYIAHSDFLMGKVSPINGHKVFRADIEWLTNQSNFTKVSEEKYHG